MSVNTLTLEPVPREVPAPEGSPSRSRRVLRAILQAFRRLGRAIASFFDWIFGAIALTIGLAVLAATPVAQLLCLGYLLEASGRVARTGRLRDGLIGVRKASRLGSVVVGVSLFLIPLWVVSASAASAEIIDPGGLASRRSRAAVIVLTVLAALQIVAACARGGRIRHFFLPFGNPFWIVRKVRQGGAYATARDAVLDFVATLRLGHYWRLGLLGFLGTAAWLIVPATLMAAGRRTPVLGFLGAILLGVVVMPLPFLQTRFAAEGRFRVFFSLRHIRRRFIRAPWAFVIALLASLVFAIPLYLLKIEIIPRETAWLPSIVFLGFIFPARLLTGWAYGRSLRRWPPRHWVFRWSGRLAMLPVAFVYVLFVFLSQYTAWRGALSLYEQHAFLLPVPFLGL